MLELIGWNVGMSGFAAIYIRGLSVFTLTRSRRPHETSAVHALHKSLQFELE